MPYPPLPDLHAQAVLCLILLALFLFTRERIPLETSSLGVLVLLLAGFQLFPYEGNQGPIHSLSFFSGFGHEALIAVCALMIAGQGLVRTGALEPVGRSLASVWSISPLFSLLLTLVLGAALSAFVNNVPIVVLLLPILTSIALRTGKPASQLLMPMGFATLVGGMSTTIGTSTNLLVVSVASELGLSRFGMFDFFIPAVITAAIAILFLWQVAPRLLPQRDGRLSDASPRIFTGHLHVCEESWAAGRSLAEAIEKTGGRMKVATIQRENHLSIVPLPDVSLGPGDRLSVRDTPDNLKEYEEVLGASLYNKEQQHDGEPPLSAGEQQIAEIVVTESSPLEGRTLARSRFADNYQLIILALHRPGRDIRTLREGVGDVPLRVGDVLLVQGDRERIAQLKREGEVLVLDATADLPHTQRAPLALSIMIAIVLAAALGVMPIAISAVCGVLLMLITRVLTWRDVARGLSAPVIMIVVASLALGSALLQTGGAHYLAQLFVAITWEYSPKVILAGLMLVMAIITNVVSNNAAAVIGTPIAVSIAQQLGLPPEPYVLAVLFGANMSYVTPMAYKTNLLVMSAGGYRFGDFARVGVPLTLIVWLSLSWLLPTIYKL